VTIHSTDPFATPEQQRSPVRRLRGRLAAAVTLWTATAADQTPAGLTVSSTMVVDGTPGRLLGVLDSESALWEAVRASEQFCVCPLRAGDQRLADRFGGVVPAPGGPFKDHQWRLTGFGPVLVGMPTWAGCKLERAREVGWHLLVEATIEEIHLDPGGAEPPLLYYRGRYATPAG
jgi:3-hydroxy-9,10-secoandrosta-1,3,5(10)-triene-9,17-dione monooxygenase reductase component